MNDQLPPTLELRSPHSVSQFSAVGLEHRQNAIPDPTTFNDMLDFKMFPKQRNFVKDMRKHSGSFLIKLFLSIILIVASQFTQAQTIGQSAVSRSYLDSSQGILNADNTNLSSYINYRVSSYQFYSSAAGRQITPVLVEDTGSSLIVRGIGATRTAANGVNNFSFSLVSGSDVIANSNYRLGWRNGPTSTAAQQGVVNWNSGGASYDLHQPGGSSSISVGGSYGIDAQSPFSRTYSINWTLATPADSEPTSQAYSASATSGLNSSSLSWGRGNGTNVIVFAAQTTGGSPSISDGSSYFASSSFGSGSSAGAGWYCVYNSSGSNVTVTNLSQNTNYRFAVYEYNNTYGTYNYNQSVGSNLINTTTDTPPTVTSITVPGSSTGAFPITINFSENVTGFDITDLSVGNGNASNFQTLSSSQYTADIAPLADGTTTIDIGIGLFQDFAGNANTAAANQASVTVTAKLALNFNGSNENVTIARTAITEGLTYEAWIKTSTTAGDPSYAGAPGMAIIGDYNNDVGFSFGLTNGLLEMNHFTSSWQTVSGTNSVANGSWHHVAVSHDKASGDVVLYLDGSVEATGNIPWSAVADYHSFNRIGSTYTSGTLDGQFFQGDMDEVRIWNKPLSLAHINYYMDNELTGNEVGLIACYNFEEGTGTDLINVEGTTALNGSLQNMDNTNWSGGNASIGAPLGTEPDFVMDFDGTTQYVEVADDDAFSFGDGTTDQKLSMEAWVNFDVVTLQTIVSKRASASEWHFVIGSSGNPSIILMDNSAGGYIEKESTGISFTPGEWYHLAFTYDGSGTGNGITIYVDGTDVGGNATIVGSYTAMENTTSPVQIGTVNGGATFPTNGRLDEVRIWSVERTAAQINAFKDVELNGGEPNLVGYWNFENAGGSTIRDLAITDGAQNGTMTNMDPANDYVLQSNVANAGAQDTTPPSPTIATSSATTDSPIAIDIDFGEVVVNFEEADLTVVNAIIHNFTNVDGQNYTADLYANAAGTVTADISAGVANDLTGNASLIASQFSISANSPNNALAFSASDYVSIPHDPLFDLADDFTVEFWFNHTTSGNVIIIEKGNNNAEWSIQQSSGLKIILNIGNSATSTNGTYNDGNWHHAVVIYRGANDASIYIDGVDDTDNVNVGTPNYATYDGDVNIGGRGTSNSYNGTLDEIRIWDDERTFGEIQSFQNSSLIGNEDGLIAYYRFDETSGLNLPDLSGNARDGTLNNMTGTEWTTSTAFVLSSPTNLVAYASSPTEITLKWTDNSISENNYLIERADDFGFTTNVTTVDATLLANATTYVHSAGTNTGYFYRVTPTNGSEDASSQSSVEFATTDAFPGSGMEFTALTDRVVISNPENFEENILTVEAWVNTTSTTDFSRVAACGDGGGQRWSLNVNGTSWGFPVGKAVATAQFSGGAAYAASITDVNDGQWHHIAATYNLTTTAVQIYVDGVLEGSGSSSGSSTTAAAHVTLGNFHAPWDQSLQGQLDEVKIWNNIKSDFSDRFSPVDLSMAQPNLIGYFPLDENGGTTTVDRSANNNDGTILGATFVTSGAGAIPIYNATAVTTSAFTANWEAIAGGADDLTVEWGTGGSFANNTVLSGGAQNGSSSVVSASLTTGTVYEYRIKATVGGNETAYSDPVSFMVQPGSALPFTGDDFVTVADNALLEPSGDFTIEYWMNTNAVATQIIIEKGSSNSEYSVQQSSSGEIVLNANGIMRSNAGFNDGNWHHVAIVYRGANNGVIYIDGADETSSNALGVPAFSASPLVIGSRNGTAFSLEGSIDEVRIWDDERTIGEIQTNQFAAVTGNEQGLVAYYRFDETSGTVLPDLTGNGLDGTLTNMAGTEWTASGAMAPILNEATNVTVNGFTMNWEAIANATGLTFDLDDDSDFSTPILTDVAVSSPTGSTEIVSQDLSAYKNQELHLRIRFAKGAFQSVYSETVSFYVEPNYAFDFDGSNDYVNIPDADELSFGNGSTDSPFSVEAWAKFDNVTSKSIVSKRTGSNEWHMTLSGGGRLSVALVDNSSSGFLFGENSTFTFVTDQWYHLAFSYDGSATAAGIRLYVDGVEIPNSPSSSGTYTAMENTSSPVQIGAINTSTNLMDGQIDEVRIWNVARTESDLIANMNNELTGNEANLVAYYNFSDAGTLLTDLAGLNNGTVNGATRTFPALNIDTAPEINLYDLTITPASTEITVDIKLDGSANLYYVVTQSATAPSAAQILIGHDDENNQAYNYGNYNGVSSAGNFEIGGDNGANDSPFDPEANYHIYWVAYNSPSDYSEVIASAFTTEALPPEVTLTTVPLADANLFQSSSDNLVYKFTMAVTGGSVSTQGFFFGLGGSFSSADFTASGFTLLQNTIDDFGSATVVGSSSYEPGAPVPANSTGWLFDNTYNDGDLIYFYVSADIDAMAGVGNTFNISQPGLNPNFGINEPKTMIDGGLAIGQTFTIITADAIPPTLVSLSPADEAFDVPTTSSTFQLTFDEDMKKGTGNIEFRLASNNTLITTLDVLDPQVSISGAVVTLGVNGLVDCSEGVSVIIPSSALTDLGENTFSGLTSGDWDFYGPTSPVIDFSADMVVDNTNCGGIPSGSLDANDAIFKDGIPAPSSSFDFQWFLNSPGGTPAGSTSSITNLSAGNYYLVVTESSTGCTSDPELFVVMDDFTDVPVLSVSNQPDRFCVNGNGEITVMASSSNEPSDYTFKLYNGIGTATTPIVNEVSIGSTGIIKTDLEEGTYTIEVINNATLCSTIQQTTILENTQLPSINSANVSVSDVTDCGGTDGAIDVSLGVEEDGSSQSAANYSFEWFTGSGTSGAAAGSGAILSAVGQGTYTVKFTNNITGCFSASEFSIGLNDQTDPVAIAQDLTVSLDPFGTAIITANDIDNGSFDNCGVADISLAQSSFTCAHVGPNPVTLTVTDTNGNQSTATATVTIVDDSAPTAITQDLTVSLDPSGTAIITANDIDNGSFDNCGIADISIDQSSFTCINVGPNPVTLTVTDTNGNQSTAIATVTIVDDSAPTAIAQDLTVSLDPSGTATITANDIDNGSFDNCGVADISIDQSSFTCINVGPNPVTLTVTDTNGNQSTAIATVTIVDDSAPTAIAQDLTVSLDPSGTAIITANDIDNGSFDNCGVSSLSLDQSSFTCANVGPNPVTLTVTDTNGNQSTAIATVTIVDDSAPTAIAQDLTVSLDPSGTATITANDIDNGSFDNCGVADISLAQSSFTCAHVGPNPVTLTVTDTNGNQSTAIATVTIVDDSAPTAITQDLTVSLDPSGTAIITANDIDNGSFDNCGVSSLSLDQSSFTCANVGPNPVTLTVTDTNGNQSTAIATVTIVDDSAPTAIAQDLTVSLDPSGTAIITANDIDNGSFDNCGIADISIDQSSFTCINVGPNPVTLTVTDTNGNQSTAIATVTIVDDSAPTAIAQDLTVSLDPSGTATITANDIDNGSFDNCGVADISIDQSSFTCINVGPNPVTLTVTDTNGNQSTAIATVTIVDDSAPTAIAQDLTVSLDPSGTAIITANDIDNGSFDNCGIADISIDQSSFTCINVGPNPVTLTVTDTNGNQSTAIATVTIVDDSAPTAIAQDLTVSLDPSGTATITANDIDNGSFDNCGVADISLAQSSFTCAHVGPNPVTLTVTDTNGNQSTAIATVTIVDDSAPTAIAQDLTVSLDPSGTATITANDIDNGSFDNCGVADISLAQSSFTCAHVGPNPVTLTVTDTNGNQSTATATVTIVDDSAPTAIAQDLTVSLDPSGTAIITANDIDNGSFDNCGIADISIDQSSFTCINVGPNPVTLTVTDTNGNQSTAIATVTIVDDSAPTAIAQDLTVSLDPSGTAIITANDIDNGSFDNCGIADISIDQSSFTCINVGPNPVTLTVTDTNGNQSTAIATVTIVDDSAPTAIAQDLTVSLDPSGTATITANDIDNGSFDNCGVADISLAQSSFTCAHVGPNPVTLTVTDTNGNQSTAIATVTIVDDSAPTAIAQDLTVSLDPSGTATITANDIDNGSFDNCGVADISLAQSSFTCAHVGPNPVTLTVTDTNGNQSTAIATVTIVDDSAPTAITQDLTVSLDPSGTAIITANDIDNGSFDNCGVADISIDQSSFTCINVGPNPVTLTVTDTNGNQSTAIATVTIVDDSAPTAIAQDLTVSLDPSGTAIITANDIDNGSFDNCGVADISLAQSSFTCAHVGPNPVTLTVTDTNGNQSTAIATVTIVDDSAPTAIAQDLTVSLDPFGTAIITANDIDNGSFDNCGVADISLAQSSFTCAHVGPNPVTLTVTDTNGNQSTATATVTIVDDSAPTAITQDLTVSLDPSGTAIITANDIDNGSFDNCGIADISIDQSSFTCINVGPNPVTLTVTDTNGNQSTAIATVTIVDDSAPTAIAQDLTVSLDPSGTAIITANDIDNGSFDNCGVADISIDQSSFTCAHAGPNAVVLTVTDINGNVSQSIATVTILEDVLPVAVVQDITIGLDENGSAIITPSELDNGSNDNCGIPDLFLDKTAFTCADLGNNIVNFTARDRSGNESSTTAIVTVVDDLPPSVLTQNITVELDATGSAAITAEQIDNGSFDNCMIQNIAVDISSFTCTDVGANLVTFTATDGSGNQTSATATVTVVDAIPPTVLTQNITVELDEAGSVSIAATDLNAGSFDNCEIASFSVDQSSFTCSDLGSNLVNLTVTDVNGNANTAVAYVLVEDNTPPIPLGQDIIVSLDEFGNANINQTEVNNGSNDNCGVSTVVLSNSNFTCADVGANTVEMLVRDGSGNESTTTVTVTVEDNIAPVVSTRDINVTLNTDGTASITASQIDNASIDNCAIAGIGLDKTSFTCEDVGSSLVNLTVTDVNGNSATASATVTVTDATLPIVPIKNVTISLDESGAASIDVADIDNGSSDNCGISTVELSQTGFDCTDLGTNAVTLTATDVNGNQKTATASVTVLDNNVPTAIAQDATISLDQNGFASITAADIDNGSTDNCTISSRVVSVTNFTCVNLGANVVTLTVTDASGNQSMATASVTVTDNIAPIAKAKAINISLDANGVANFTAEDIDNGSSDNCGVASLSADISSFTCAEIGSNTVMLTATDESGNSTTVETTVIVNDNTSPTVATQDITVSLDATGIVSITPADVDAGSADNCGIADMSLSKTTFTCGNIGTNVVTLTVTDLNGFSSSAPAVVTVVDDLAPVAIAKDLTVYLDQTGMAYIGTNEINDGSNDNCSMGAMSLDVASFSCDNIGENAVVLTVTDLAGNQSTATATVTVVDDKAPMAVAKNLTVSLDENGMANFDADQIDNGSSDNCAVSDTSIDISSFTCAHLGANDVTITVTDVNGNTSTASATVTVVDNVPPIAVSQNISIELSPEGAGSITVAQIENGSSDNCAIANISLSQSDFDCSHIGENEIQLIIEDDAGNISMSTAIVTVFSLANPQVTTQNITVSLDETGTATITPEQVDNGSVSGCGDPVLSLDKSTFDCTNLGENTVLLTVANTSGTSVSGEAIITVVDNTDPIFTTANKSFDLDENGNVTITSADLVAESEECLTFSLSSYEFSCDNEGQNEVVVTATDAGGNTSEQTATVTILSGEGGTDFEIITSTATQCEGDDVNLMPVVNTMGSALVFSSTSVSTPTTQELNLSSNSAFTIELWFKPASTSRASLISKMSDGGRGYELFFEDGEIGYNLTHNTSGSAVSGKTTNAALSMGEWHHLAFGFDGFQSPSVIIDGTIQNHNIEVNNLTDSLSNSSPLYIGSLGGTQQQFVGAIDEVRIWTEERNLVEIQRLKDVRLDSSFSNLILLYDFENVAAGIVRDKSGYNHHGTVGENALFENRPEKAIDTAKYTFNLLTNIGNENSRAGVLSGSRNPIIARTSAGLSGASSGTIEMWVQWHGTTQDSGYRGAYGVVSSRQYSTRYTSSIIALDNEDPNKAHLIWRPFDQYRNRIVSNRVLDNEWHHVAVTFANNEHRMYIDGELVGSATVTGSMFNIPSSQLIIGGWKFPETVTRTRRYNYRTRRWEVRTQKRIYHEYESFANAGIDEVRVWSRALTQDEIKANKDDFDAKQNGDGLSLYYDFESDFTSGRVLDRSRYRNTGTGVLALGDRPVQFVNPTFLKSGVVVSSKTAMTHVIETTNKISGCSSRDTVYIDIGYPSTPVIASRDNLIVCDEEVGNIRLYMSGISGDPAQSYQWYKDGYRIPNATQANYTASTEGDYRLEVTNSSGCPGISNSITVRSYAISGRILGEATRNSCGKTATIEVEHKNGELFRLQYYYVRYRSWRWYGNWSTATSFEVNPGYRWRVAIASKSCQSRYTDYVYINATHAYESRIANINGSALSTESVDGATQYVTFTGTWVKSYYNHSTSDVDYSWLKDGAAISSDSKIQLNETGIYELIIRNKDGSCEFTGTKLRALAGPSVSLALDTSSGSSCSAGNLQATVDANGIDPSDLKFYWSASYDYVWATTETSFKPYGGYAYQFVVEYKGVRAFSNAVSVPKTEPNISIKAKAAYRCGSRRRPGLVYDANASTNAGNLTYRFYKAYSYFDYRLYKYRVGYKLVETNTTGKYSTYGYGTYSVLASDECNQYVRGSSRLYLNYCGRIYETDDTDVIAADTVVFSADLNLVDLDSLGNETPILVDIGAPMEAPQTDYQFDVSLSPQPAATFTTVKISTMIDHDIEQLEISLYDISGQLMQTKTLNDVRAGLSETYLDVSNLAGGVYLYTINSKGHELDAGRLAILKR